MILDADGWRVVAFTLECAALATLLLTPPAFALAWLLARGTWRGRSVVDALLTLPLVVPPVATGLVLLKLFGRRGAIGQWLYQHFGASIVFTPKAVVLAMMVMSMPLLVRALRVALEGVDRRYEAMAASLGASRWRVLFSITTPMALRGITAGLFLAFARALGEFGATVMVAGNIPRHTSTISLAIYNAVELGRDDLALRYAAVAAVIAFAALLLSQKLRGAQR